MNDPNGKNITWHPTRVTPEDRNSLMRQKGVVLWMTGLSGSGKSSIAVALEAELIQRGHPAYILDGDNIRHGLNADLDFSQKDRGENIRRIAHVAALLADAGLITITAFISPYAEDRDAARDIINRKQHTPVNRFREVYINTPLEICEQRDPKALYAKARRGEITNFTGIDAPFEAPASPEIEIPTNKLSVAEAVDSIIHSIQDVLTPDDLNAK